MVYQYVLTLKGVVERMSVAAAPLRRMLEKHSVLKQETETLKSDYGSGNCGAGDKF